MSVPTGREIGPYRIEKRLGVGGMGEVFSAYDRRLERRVALKHVLPDATDPEGGQARFRREAWSVAQLSHPSIVQIFDVLEEEDGDWIVMEKIEGTSLAERLRSGSVDLASALRWGRQVAEGLAEAHGKGVIHRDLKAENVMVTRAGRAKILDFGLAKPVWKGDGAPSGVGDASLTVSGMILGTCRSMSPEQARGLAVDARSDLFSFGILLYEMVTGTTPFKGGTPMDTMAQVLGHQQAPAREVNPYVPEELSDLIEQLLQKSPELRPESAEEVAARLAEIAGLGETSARTGFSEEPTMVATGSAPPAVEGSEKETGVEQRPTSALDAWPPPGWKRRAPVVALAAVLVLIAAVALVPSLRQMVVEGLAGTSGEPKPGSAYEHTRRGMELLERYDREGNIEKAIDDFQRALALDGDSAPAHAGLARAYWRKYFEGNRDASWLEKALPVAERAVALDGFLAEARISLGRILMELGRVQEAESEFREVLVMEPTNADAHYGLARISEKRNEIEAAEASYLEALAHRPASSELHYQLGSLYFRNARYEEAEASFRRTVELLPDSTAGYENLAAALFMRSEISEAAEAIQTALEIEPSYPLYSNLGSLLFYQGLYSQAADAYGKALELGGGLYPLWGNLGDAYRWSPDGKDKASEAYRTAIRLAEEELEATPDDLELRSRLKLYRAKRGDCDLALTGLAAFAEQTQVSANTLYRSAVAYELCGRRGEALGVLEAALRAGYSAEEAARDPELLKLRTDPRFQTLRLRLEEPG